MLKGTFVKYTKYAKDKLEQYLHEPNSCVVRQTYTEFIDLMPKDTGDLREGITRRVQEKIGRQHIGMVGVVIGYRKIRVENGLSAIRYDSPQLFVKATVDYYLFQPTIGATVKGTVKYASHKFISATMYKVFNVTIKLNARQGVDQVVKGKEITFVIKSFDMGTVSNELPFIEGDLVQPDEKVKLPVVKSELPTKVKKEEKTKRVKKRQSSANAEQHDPEIRIKVEPTLNGTSTVDDETTRKVKKEKKAKRTKEENGLSTSVEKNGLSTSVEEKFVPTIKSEKKSKKAKEKQKIRDVVDDRESRDIIKNVIKKIKKEN